MPDPITNGQNYVMQFGRRFSFGVSGGTVMTPTRIAAQSYLTGTMDALVTNVGAGGTTNIQIGVGTYTAVFSQTLVITQPTTIHIPITGTAISQYIASQPVTLTDDVPFTVTIDRQADVILTNLALTPAPQVDLAVSSGDLAVGCPGAPACLASEGMSVPLTVTVHNNGAQDVAAAVVSYYAGDPQAGGQLLGSSYFSSIPFGGSSLATFAWDTTGFTHTQTLFALVDPPNAIAETFETNNTVSTTLYVRTKADLNVPSLSFSATDRVVGERITATVGIANSGETAAPASTLSLATLGERGDAAGSIPATGGVPATGTVTLTVPFTPTAFGMHVLTVTADISNAVTEFNESNNVVTATFFVGLPATDIQAGDAGDLAYDAGRGYGYLNGSSYDFGSGGSDQAKTVRFDGFGNLQYRFDGLQAGRFYHFDATFYEEGDTFTQQVLFNGVDSGIRIPMNSGAVKKVSLIVPPAAYAGSSSVTVSIQRLADGAAPARGRFTPAGASGASFVSELALTPIEYTYIDAGNAATDLPYSAARGYGYLNGFASGSGGAAGTYRTSFTSTVYYQFDHLRPSAAYVLDLSMFDSTNSGRLQSIAADGTPICGPYALNGTLTPRCVIPSATYTGDGRVTIAISRTNGTGPLVNELALEEQTASIVNWALGQPAAQSSTFGGGAAGRAVDGNTDGSFGNGSVTSTGPDPEAWWQVDLGASQSIGNIQVWNRSDCCANRLSGFYVFVSDTPFASTNLSATLSQSGVFSASVAGPAGTPSVIAVNRTGHYVRVQLSGADYLSLAEVQVLAPGATSSAPTTLLSSFSAQRAAIGVDVAWAAGSEYNLKSYDLYRSSDDALWSLVAQQPAGSDCQYRGSGATYRVNDPNAAAGQIYYYRLVLNGDQCGAGHASYLGAVVAQASGGGAQWQLWLPLIRR